MLPFHGKRHARKSMLGPTRQLMNDGRPRQHHSMTKTVDVGNILQSSWRNNTADISGNTRGLGNFTTVTQEDSTVMTQTSQMMNPGTRGNSSNHPSPKYTQESQAKRRLR
ncbi:hypothetical protein PoB_002892500 [Plakobranchus ocellatus]|uniref:Uncharacterized protein n=1 Tax=Plakobranchus ocellatus TaxID=259542 RepID=A0AAV4A4W7_9GAST|nr:hypothetical protein PoB_002892500 [Plakobranchus ocellatus]